MFTVLLGSTTSIIFSSLGGALLKYYHDSRSVVNFALMTSTASLWCLGSVAVAQSVPVASGQLGIIAFLFAPIVTSYYLVSYSSGQVDNKEYPQLIAVGLQVLVTFILFFDTLDSQLILTSGAAYLIYSQFFLVVFLVAFRNLRRNRFSGGFYSKLGAISLLFFMMVNSVTNILLPVLGEFGLVWLGPASGLCAAIFHILAFNFDGLLSINSSFIKFLVSEIFESILLTSLVAATIYFVSSPPIDVMVLVGVFVGSVNTLVGVLLRQYLGAARQRSIIESKDEVLSIAAHQLRSPISVSMLANEMLLEGEHGELNAKQAASVKTALNTTRHMEALVRDLLEMARIEQGTFRLDIREIDLADIVSNVIEEIRPIAEEKSIHVEFISSEISVRAEADSKKIAEVIANFIDNAIKYSPVNSSVEIILEEEADEAVVTVADSGFGVLASEVDLLFAKYWRSSLACQNEPDGLGIGLYLAKNIIDAHGGSVFFSARSKGSVFGFRIPTR